MYKVKIDNKEISVKDGFTIKEELNETLDSGTLQFVSENGQANIDPFDSVDIECEIKVSGVPNEYEVREFLETTGGQYLNTGIKGGKNLRLELDMIFEQITHSYEGWSCVFGTYYGQSKFSIWGEVSGNRLVYYTNEGGSGIALNYAPHQRNTVIIESGNSGVESNEDLYLGAINNSGSYELYRQPIKIYNAKIYKNGELVFNGVPVMRKSNNTFGLYDTVGKRFIVNSGRYEFRAGKGVIRKKLLVDTYQNEIVNFNKNNIEQSDFQYLVNLFSETKLLERITLPNLAITKRANGTARTVWSVIKSYCKRYLPYARIYDAEDGYRYKPSLKYDETMETKFNMECPEFIWNTPTLKEVLIDLMSVADCIPVIKDNVLTYFDLNKKGNEIDTSKLTNMQSGATSADYCDSLTLPMKNVISKKPVIVKEHLLPHAPIGTGEMTSNNAVYITRKPIYKIRSAKMYVYGYLVYLRIDGGTSRQTKVFSGNITNRILEKEKFDQLSNNINLYSGTIYNNVLKNKCGNLWFERGSNYIQNIGIKYKRRLIPGASTDDVPTYAFIGESFVNNTLEFAENIDAFQEYSYDAPFIELEYETIEETTINVSKASPIKNKGNALFDSQSANSVDLEHQTIFEYAKANRLASKITTIYGEYDNELDIPKLSDYIGNKILFSREITYYDGVIMFKGMLCENYILRDYFTGVNAKERSWNIVDTNEAILRNDIYKFYVLYSTKEFSYEVNITMTDLPYRLTYWSSVANEFADFTQQGSNVYNVALVKTRDASNVYRPSSSTEYGIIDLMEYEVGKSLIYSVQHNDNFSYGNKVIKDDNIYTMEPVAYTDANGEHETYQLHLRTSLNELQAIGKNWNTVIAQLQNRETFDKDDLDEVLGELRKHPIAMRTGGGFEVDDITIVKDNREIKASTIQFEYLSADEKVIVYDDLPKIFSAGSKSITDLATKYGDEPYKVGELTPKGTSGDMNNIVVGLNDDTGAIRYTNNNFIGDKCWCIYSVSSGKILLAVNNSKRVYCNETFSRDLNIYNSQIDKVKIGEVYDDITTLSDKYRENPPEITEIALYNRIIDIDDLKDF